MQCRNLLTVDRDMVTALCSESPMFRRFSVQKIFVKKVLCSEGSIFRRSYVQKVLCSEGSIFRRFYVQKVLHSDILRRSYIQKKTLFHFGTNIFQFQVNYNVRQQITASHFRSFSQRSYELLSQGKKFVIFIHSPAGLVELKIH